VSSVHGECGADGRWGNRCGRVDGARCKTASFEEKRGENFSGRAERKEEVIMATAPSKKEGPKVVSQAEWLAPERSC
jgi:hypothetical protein